MADDDRTDLPNFTLCRRLGLRHELVREVRRPQAQAKRVVARLLHEERVREAQAKVRTVEDAAAIGRLLTSVGLTGWKKVLKLIGVSAPQEALEGVAETARAQLARLVAEDGPRSLALADESARAIEEPGGSPEPDRPSDGAQPSDGSGQSGVAPPRDGGGRWG